MSNLSIEEQIKKTNEKLAQLKARQAAITARKSSQLASKSRSDRKRRLMLTGVAIHKLIDDGVLSRLQVDEWLNAGVTRESERRFLNLPAVVVGTAFEGRSE